MIEKYYKLEEKKHREFFLPYYEERNWIVVQDNIGKGKYSWDVKLEVRVGEYITVDEKVRTKNYDDFLLEIIQDMKTGNLGWLFGDKDYVFYASWDDMDKYEPISFYIINMFKLKEYLCNLDGSLNTFISKKGWGTTWNLKIDWKILLDTQIAQKII